MQHLSESLIQFIQHLGSWGIFLGMFIESACIPLPSEVIMLYGGFMVHKELLTFWSVIVAGIVGNLIGSLLMYWIGARFGRPFIEKYGKYVFFNYKHLEAADRWFAKYGDWAAFFGRLLPVIRTFISLPAGIAKMKAGRFALFTVLGCIPWNITLAFFGMKLGQHWEIVQTYLHPVTYIILVILVLLIIRFIYRLTKDRRMA
ncbi:DedA family protein [Pullulanibacillus sp. KACC 23026]|uniref:DedA family protein n=1 Tax=Pullulanibacillus sp. KACC 23026 TaxID=3028315 RepID=UPI0023B16C5F|nr:DedA family protein [Pullulanibacillus sp. KACC 23026]WEG13729.1 DedA family protein [Pullulanibacillus sp. KACC 23026]